MEPEFQHHPWQAFPLTLFKIAIEKVSKADDQPQFATENLRINGNSTEAQWPANIVNKLEAILSEYDCFQIAPIFDSRQNDMRQKPNYFEYMRVYNVTFKLNFRIKNINYKQQAHMSIARKNFRQNCSIIDL